MANFASSMHLTSSSLFGSQEWTAMGFTQRPVGLGWLGACGTVKRTEIKLGLENACTWQPWRCSLVANSPAGSSPFAWRPWSLRYCFSGDLTAMSIRMWWPGPGLLPWLLMMGALDMKTEGSLLSVQLATYLSSHMRKWVTILGYDLSIIKYFGDP